MAEYKGIALPDDLHYEPKEHIWAKVEGDKVRFGLDKFGLKASGGNLQYVKLKPAGGKVKQGKPFGSIEAGKYIGPLKAPVSGTIVEVNQDVIANPGLVDEDPYGKGFFIQVEPENLSGEMGHLVGGSENIQKWLEKEYQDYEAKGLFKEE